MKLTYSVVLLYHIITSFPFTYNSTTIGYPCQVSNKTTQFIQGLGTGLGIDPVQLLTRYLRGYLRRFKEYHGKL